MSDELNPYAPPPAPKQEDAKLHTIAPNALRASSLGLLILSVVSGLGGLLVIFILVVHSVESIDRLQSGLGPSPIVITSQDLMSFAAVLLSAVSSMIVFPGAVCMRRQKQYRIALAAAVLSCVPILSPLLVFGIPFGIWALIVLRRPAVRAAFQS